MFFPFQGKYPEGGKGLYIINNPRQSADGARGCLFLFYTKNKHTTVLNYKIVTAKIRRSCLQQRQLLLCIWLRSLSLSHPNELFNRTSNKFRIHLVYKLHLSSFRQHVVCIGYKFSKNQ